MATLYFNAAVDSDWNTLGNWWTSAAFTTQASALPTSSDSVVLSATCDANSGSAPTVVDITVNNVYLIISSITVTGNATFTDDSANNSTITGTATFEGTSRNNGTVTLDATFNEDSYNNNQGTVSGNATFNVRAHNDLGIISGDATFNDSSYNDGTVSGDATFSDDSYNSNLYGNNDGTVAGDATFRGQAYNRRGISGSVILAYEKGINGSSILGVV